MAGKLTGKGAIWVGVREGARLAGCSYHTLWRAVQRGEVASRRIGPRGHHKLLRSEVERWAGLRK